MPFSFVQIERDETQTIQWSFAVLILFYFFGASVLVFAVRGFILMHLLSNRELMTPGYRIHIFDWGILLWTFLGAGVAGFIHWNYSTDALIDKILWFMHGRVADPLKDDEKMFQNIVEEVSVATGGRYRIEPYIIPTSAMNAFAVQDFQGRSVIGITEGLLKRLNRGQLEAVIAHEAGHIASGDSLSTCVTSSIFNVFDNISDAAQMIINGAAYDRRGGGGAFFMLAILILVLSSILKSLGFLGSMFISRQREYRADAISVRLTRNPVALAEALYIISNRWKGVGMPGQSMEAIFIMSPRRNYLEDNEDWFSDLFTTHPPINRRIGILLDMAHTDKSVLDSALSEANARYTEPVSPTTPPDPRKGFLWMAMRAGQWVGPMGLDELRHQDWLTPTTMVRKMGAPVISQADEDNDLFPALPAKEELKKNQCPRCQVDLMEVPYEKVRVLKCPSCQGVLVKEMDVLSILGTREMTFSSQIAEMGDIMMKQPKPLQRSPYDAVYDEKSILCPWCLTSSPRMTRRFINPRYPIEIDKCRICARVWFDKDELEILQYLYEKDSPLPAGKA
ncbi:MAG: M48 family metalloprotease [Candidatus Omnitrophica bacterium]|nr:M48 family metalloprotease [Candidatus Omnitrophota bacterium]